MGTLAEPPEALHPRFAAVAGGIVPAGVPGMALVLALGIGATGGPASVPGMQHFWPPPHVSGEPHSQRTGGVMVPPPHVSATRVRLRDRTPT